MLRAAITFLILFLVGFAQSLTQQKGNFPAPTDTTRIQALIDSSYENSYSNPNRAIEFANEALKLSNKIDFKKGIAGAHRELGYAFTTKGKFQKALEHYNEGIAISRAIGDSLGWVSMLNDVGTSYKSMSQYDRSLEYYFDALALCEEMKLERGVSATLGNIGLSYFEMNEHDKALEFYQRALEINQRLENKASLAVNYNNIGLLHGDEGRYEQAHEFHSKALELRRELGYTIEIANSLNNIGRLHMQQEHYELAVDYLMEALEINNSRDQELSSIIHENLAKLYISSEEYDSAITHAKQTLSLSEDFGTQLGVKIGHELMADVYQKMGDFEKALVSQQNLMAVKDNILNAEKARQINELQTKYETAQKEKEIALLEQEKQRQAILRNVFLAGLILVGTIGFLVYNRQKLKIRKNRTELENRQLKEKQLIRDLEFKNRELTNHSLHLVQKNETMKQLRENISEIKQNSNGLGKELQKLENMVNYSFNLDEDWEQFQHYFEEVHSGFFDVLKNEYPDLTPNELRLAALAKLNLTIKETATIMGITPNSVKTARYRLRKKLGMETEENLTSFMMELEKSSV